MSKTLFIHIPKNAGTTVKNDLPIISVSRKYVSENHINQINQDPQNYYSFGPATKKFIQHTPYNLLDRNQVKRFDRKFAIVRNPWSRMVSLYNYAQSQDMKWFGNTWYYQDPISWESFINRMDSFKMTTNYYWQTPYDHWASQSDWVVDKGEVRVNILRYENLQNDLQEYFNKKLDLSHLNKGESVDYRSYYTESQKQKVAEWYKYDINLWGFSFESGATRNYWTQ